MSSGMTEKQIESLARFGERRSQECADIGLIMQLAAAQKRIEQLESANKGLVCAMMHCIESVRSIVWGYEGDGGATNAVEIMDDRLAEIQAKANGGANT